MKNTFIVSILIGLVFVLLLFLPSFACSNTPSELPYDSNIQWVLLDEFTGMSTVKVYYGYDPIRKVGIWITQTSSGGGGITVLPYSDYENH